VVEGLEIRCAENGESEAIAEVLRKAFAPFEHFYTPEAYAATTVSADEINRRFAEGPLWVALENGETVGTASVMPKGDQLYLRSMAILPSSQGRGIGQELLDAVEGYARQMEFAGILLYTTPFLAGAIRLYEQNGFERAGDDRSDDFFGTYWFPMEKKLIGAGKF
jgi:putative acetyltransferase